MKKITSYLAILPIACSLFTLAACNSTYEHYLEEDFQMGYSEKRNEAFVGRYYWSGSPDDLDIVIPNTYKGAPVTQMGGYTGLGVPSHFELYYSQADMFSQFGLENYFNSWHTKLSSNTAEEVRAAIEEGFTYYRENFDRDIEHENFEIVDIVFNLYIGSNLQEICKISWNTFRNLLIFQEEETVTVYAISVMVTVDEQNEWFYSDDLGRMYYKESGTLVNYFLYHNRETFPENSLPKESLRNSN